MYPAKRLTQKYACLREMRGQDLSVGGWLLSFFNLNLIAGCVCWRHQRICQLKKKNLVKRISHFTNSHTHIYTLPLIFEPGQKAEKNQEGITLDGASFDVVYYWRAWFWFWLLIYINLCVDLGDKHFNQVCRWGKAIGFGNYDREKIRFVYSWYGMIKCKLVQWKKNEKNGLQVS